MESKRQQRVARLLQKDLAEIMRVNSRKFATGVIISVTVVRLSPDLGLAKVYLSVFPSGKSKEVIESITQHSKSIRYELGTKVGKQLRIVPELRFYLDDSIDYAAHIDDLLS
ncbi:MAG: 30S ribosome-binding factor RbfA [Bacteroidales bacterium]|nr:30S ribosome-binding factor RbfA [Bacteroidales bacterium]